MLSNKKKKLTKIQKVKLVKDEGFFAVSNDKKKKGATKRVKKAA